jgi:penicillin G amidase
MAVNSPPHRPVRRAAELIASLVALALVLFAAAVGGAGVPALGAAFNPGTGVWRLSPDATGAASGQYALTGLRAPATVVLDRDGVPQITTHDDGDLWRVIGYVQARFRLSQMDLQRREAGGTLAQILGPSAVGSDEFELDLGLRRAAERDWARMPSGPARTALTAYSSGVNSAVRQLRSAHELPTPFKLLGYSPSAWTPVDSLVIQRLETQALSFADTAATYSYVSDALGPSAFRSLFPTAPAGPQHPYDPGPYTKAPLTALPVRADAAGGPPVRAPGASPVSATASGAGSRAAAVTAAVTVAGAPGLGPLLARTAALPAGALHGFGASNSWAVSGAKTVSGKPLLAADPHLDFSLPPIWYQLGASSPGYRFAGVTIPGVPLPLLGRTDSFSWGVTDAQHPTTLFYLERTTASRPGQYYWKGAWRRMDTIGYSIAVKGEADVHHTVRFAAQGPVLQSDGVTAAVWWAGTLPGRNVAGLLAMLHARDFASFRRSLSGWAAPSLNFTYADRAGHIGAFGVGVAPQVPGHDIGLPLPGDGSADVAGSIPYAQLPHSYDPPSGYLATANQREVGASYPYEYSSSFNFPDQGWRAARIDQALTRPGKVDAGDFQRLQTDQHDQLAQRLLPAVLRALRGTPHPAAERQAFDALSSWDGDMSVGSIAPTVFRTFVDRLVHLVFAPWWQHSAVTADPHHVVALQPYTTSLASDPLTGTLAAWVEHGRAGSLPSPPGGPARSLGTTLRQAFHDTVAHLTRRYGGDTAAWKYGAHHSVQFQSLLRVRALDAGPYARGGDARTINAADGGLVRHGRTDTDITTGGASWRFVMDWGSRTSAAACPGGQSESPLSPWYEDGMAPWLAGRLEPMRYGAAPTGTSAAGIWRLTP